jgi:hypothetical protein
MAYRQGERDHLYFISVALEKNAEETAKLRAVMEQVLEEIRESQKAQALDVDRESETPSTGVSVSVDSSDDVQADEESGFSYE